MRNLFFFPLWHDGGEGGRGKGEGEAIAKLDDLDQDE